MPRFSSLGLVVACALIAPAHGQNAVPPKTAERWVGINAYAVPEGLSDPVPEGRSVLRRAELIEEPETLLRLSDPVVASWPGGNALPGGATLTIPVGADRRLGKCTAKAGRSVTEAEAARLCDLVTSRMTVVPALLSDGKTAADTLEVAIELNDRVPYNKDQTGPVRRFYLQREIARPGPPPSGMSWPFRQQFHFWQKPAKTKLQAEKGLAAPLAPDTPWVAAFLGDGGTYNRPCFRVASSGDRQFAETACALALDALKPRWSANSDTNNRSFPYLIVKAGDGVRIVEPGFTEGVEPVLPEAEKARLDALIAGFPAPRPVLVFAEVGPDGRVTQCEIRRSSTIDITDFQTCRILMAEARFTPGRDIYGMGLGRSVLLRF